MTTQPHEQLDNPRLLGVMADMSDEDFYSLIRDALQNRSLTPYMEATDGHGCPTRTAKLAVMKQICCG